ncbi:MAG: hypothetical protein KU37_10845 [Sulfuricurvum sp. PC08-66]|nr:MAG: hypothetical protein KU37_10845 [Sulfuricurvum sp. PC08-66]
MIQPAAQKYRCPKCHFTKVHQPKSDAFTLEDVLIVCPKCGAQMETTNELTFFEKLKLSFSRS